MHSHGSLRGAWHRVVISAVLCAVVVLAGCRAPAAEAPPLDPIHVPLPTIAALVSQDRGQIVDDQSLDGVSDAVRNAMGDGRRATYRSVSGISGAGTSVTGTFFIPKGVAPAGGWPVVSLGHGLTGMNTDCAPSNRPDMFGLATTVEVVLKLGMAVAVADYEGLGAPGKHPFLEPRTAAFNVIDAVRALHALFPATSTRWLAFGQSQGGQAVWAANELNKSYGDGLTLIGSVAIAPAANVTGLVRLAVDQKLSDQQLALMPMVVTAAQRAFPGVPIDRLLHGAALTDTDALTGCGTQADAARGHITAADVKPSTQADADSLADSLRKMALPQEPVSAPMLVVSGGKDRLILPSWIAFAVAQSCQMGGRIEYEEQKSAGHGDVGPDNQVIKWLADRFADAPAPSNCAGK
ncbi:MAG: hypothetical protein QOH57_682 [Mycobacterium sp.]|nr:hypothetical protein [Mycobacterium sp.]